jgi:outer membrane scaffolding protein for murein synthesis (MipA/OmpV family)
MGLVLVLAGAAAIAAGYARFRAPWARYRALKEQDANIARYESWRGGLRDSGTTGASVAMEILRKQVRDSAIVMAAGAAFVVLGLLVR